MGAKAPDTSGQQAAAREMAKLSREQFEWIKQLYEQSAPDREAAQARANQLSDLQFDYMQRANVAAQQELDRYNQTFKPIEQRIAQEAMDYDTAQRRSEAVGQALSDVNQAFGGAREQEMRAMSRMGVNPNDGRMAAMSSQLGAQQALAQAQATTNARKQIEAQGWARRMDAAGLGRNVVGNQATQSSIASNMGAGSLGASTAGLNAGTHGAGMVQQGAQTAISGMGNVASIYSDISRQQAQARGSLFSDIGQGIGAVAQVAGLLKL